MYGSHPLAELLPDANLQLVIHNSYHSRKFVIVYFAVFYHIHWLRFVARCFNIGRHHLCRAWSLIAHATEANLWQDVKVDLQGSFIGDVPCEDRPLLPRVRIEFVLGQDFVEVYLLHAWVGDL